MPLIELDTADDPRIADYRNLTDVQLRLAREPAEGLYIAESSKVLRRAVDAGHAPRSFLLAPKWLPDLEDVLARFPSVPAFVAPEATLEAITGFHLHRGALAAMHRPAPLPLADLLASARRVAVIEDMVDHTNLGAVFRSAAALGIDAVLISPRSADPLYRRAVRVSMGSVFQVPWARLGSWPEDLAAVRGAGFTLAALALTPGAVPLGAFPAREHERLALLLGTEGAGLTDAALAQADVALTIPMHGGVDSLNVAAAAAVAFWECRYDDAPPAV
ncbi:TrmH family RNA methyltransferase [Arthrobacter agilis]|uniref:TrmH family RNA methyltransferase n=1 Tax=Arthrobacter agilis TaxID=37921 RepID=UPI00277E4465|nr:RNA methyltransferase [Arthrobacter agilis]MDQ0734637.1 tRNA G18 (ribose-2'-O)-methylase SpoU [Arthrobacter agilis]